MLRLALTHIAKRYSATALLRDLASQHQSAVAPPTQVLRFARSFSSQWQGLSRLPSLQQSKPWQQQFPTQPLSQAFDISQRRFLLSGKPKRVNLQIHKPKPPALGRKIKTPAVVKHRVILKNGEYVRYQAGRRHKRTKKSKGQLRALKGTVPLVRSYARKLKKLGYKRSWWWMSA